MRVEVARGSTNVFVCWEILLDGIGALRLKILRDDWWLRRGGLNGMRVLGTRMLGEILVSFLP